MSTEVAATQARAGPVAKGGTLSNVLANANRVVPLLVSGSCIGMLTGLSTQPGVTASVISVLLFAAILPMAVLSGLRITKSSLKLGTGSTGEIAVDLSVGSLSLWWIAILSISITLGCFGGALLRAPVTDGSAPNAALTGGVPGLYATSSASQSDFERVRAASEADIAQILRQSKNPYFQQLTDRFIDDPITLLDAARIYCKLPTTRGPDEH